MRFFFVEPEVPGACDDGTVREDGVDPDTGSPRVQAPHLHFEFEGWLGDELVTSHPVFAVTRTLADRFTAAGLNGFALRPLTTSRSEQFVMFHPDRKLPEFVELFVTGTARVDDFGIEGSGDLIMSEPAVAVLRTTEPLDTDITPLS